jgi:hypothetical protein
MFAFRKWVIGGFALLALISFPVSSHAQSIPDSIELGSLENLYQKVNFKHARHITLIKDCADCHHHTAGTLNQNPDCVKCHKNSGGTASVACRSCHLIQSFSAAALRQKDRKAYHNDILGLKGAYHQACAGCHGKMGGPTGCQDCHKRKKSGDAFFSAGIYMPPSADKKGKHHGH